MKDKIFRIGQSITSRDKDWTTLSGRPSPYLPQFGKIYHVGGYVKFEWNFWWITLKEFPGVETYLEEGFESVVEELEENLLELELEIII